MERKNDFLPVAMVINCRKITWRVTRHELEPKTEEERKQVQKLKEIMQRVKRKK